MIGPNRTQVGKGRRAWAYLLHDVLDILADGLVVELRVVILRRQPLPLHKDPVVRLASPRARPLRVRRRQNNYENKAHARQLRRCHKGRASYACVTHVVSVGSEEVLDHVMLRDEAGHRRRVGLVTDLQRRGLLRVQAEDRVQEPIVLPPQPRQSSTAEGQGKRAEAMADRVAWLCCWVWLLR